MALKVLNSGEKKLFVFSTLILAIPLGAALFINRINAAPTVAIPAYPTAPRPNGYDLYVAAARAIKPAVPNVDPINDSKANTLTGAARAAQYSLARKRAWLARNQGAFNTFSRATKTPSLAPPRRSFRSFNRDWAKLRQLARDKVIESNARWMAGDADGALQSGLDDVQMGHDIRRGGGLLGSLVGIAISAIGRSVTHDTIDKLTANQAKGAARRLEKLLQTRWNYDQVLTEEKFSTQASLLETFREPKWRSPSFLGEDSGLGDRVRLYTVSKQHIVDEVGAAYDIAIANARLPFAQKGAPLPTPSDPISALLAPSERGRLNDARDLAGDRVLMLRLMLRAYRLENGVYPPNLNALVPKYLGAVPADPFGAGEPMRYKLSGKDYVLWSIGPDRIDNGGTPIPPRGKPISPLPPDVRAPLPPLTFDSKGDYVAGKNG